MERIVTTWEENGMQYTITVKPIDNAVPATGPPNEMVSIFEYIRKYGFQFWRRILFLFKICRKSRGKSICY